MFVFNVRIPQTVIIFCKNIYHSLHQFEEQNGLFTPANWLLMLMAAMIC